ncbi:DUF6286 domain-containing protein [Gordonia neofelifaecis]|uniref:Uncharacterized protein n=1 Tax=Gordonia neofelifaecis NRRL B-59395 TaxID=644548 RepID=F1YK97_9ACTN|nr:DUF6286 domain-containing protein [Gordonia neofelifaecis]EGD54943.1 hypothetical protein SCNU_12070 [Gordonia neofelifaecis NRRL B-59395]
MTEPALRDVVAQDIADTPVREPVAFPGAAIAGGVLGVALLVLSGLLVRDVLVVTGLVGGDTWTHHLVVELSAQTWSGWMWSIPILCALVGLGLLWLAIKPRRRTHLSVDGYQVAWTRPVDVARSASAAALKVPNVRRAVTSVGRKRIRVTVTAAGPVDRERIARAAADAVARVCAGRPVVVKVRDPRRENRG